MPKEPEDTQVSLSEIDTLRRQVDELKGIERRCRRAEAALKAIEERDRLLGDSTPLGIFTTDVQGQITGINRKMLNLFSMPTANDPKTINLFDYPGLAGSGIVDDIQRCMAQKITIIAAHPYIDPQGACVYLRYHLSPIPGNNRTVSGVMAIVEDNTDLKSAEEALRKARNDIAGCFNLHPLP
jgi:PAS domain-containing protein